MDPQRSALKQAPHNLLRRMDTFHWHIGIHIQIIFVRLKIPLSEFSIIIRIYLNYPTLPAPPVPLGY